MAAETLQPGASVAEVARNHGLNASMLFLWRGDPRFGPGRDASAFLPVEIRPSDPPATSDPAAGGGTGSASGPTVLPSVSGVE